MFCHHCGAQVDEGLKYCTRCGQTLGEAGAPVPPPPVTPPYTPPASVQVQSGKWISQGWALVSADLGLAALGGLLVILLNGLVPIILGGPLIAGFHILYAKKILGRRIELGDLFKGFNYFVPALVAYLLVTVFVSIGVLLCIIPGLVVAAMYMFPYLFIVDKRMDFWPAMQASHAIVRQNYVGFTLFFVLLGLINLLGLLCCLVGLLITLPLTYAAITVAYRDLVGLDPATSGIPA